MSAPDRLASIGGIPVTWLPAPVSNYGGARLTPTLLIVHDIEGSAQSGIDTLSSPTRGGSVHFIADPQRGRFVQMVGLGSVAWGCGNWAQNQRAVQIELPGFAGQPYDEQTTRYAALWLGELSRLYGIPLVKLSRADLAANPQAAGVCGHADIPDPHNPALGGGEDHHGDPGPTFPWSSVLGLATGGGVAPTSIATFPTGYRVTGGFAAYFADNGGVAVFGYPLSGEFSMDGLTVQYFERARLEYHQPGSGPLAGQITRGRVGAELIEATGLRQRYPAAFTAETSA